MMQWNINRINDYLFKWVFGREENKDILLSFVNSVLSGEDTDGKDELVDLMLVKRELDPEHITDKLPRLDILGKADDGSRLNIEVQVVDLQIADLHNEIDKRTLFYWSKLYQGQMQTGQQYNGLSRTIIINVLGFSFLPYSENYHSIFSLYDVTTEHRLNKDLEIHFLELSKWQKLNISPRMRLNKWLTYLANSSPAQMEEIAMDEPAIKKALMLEEAFFKQEKHRYLYEMREKFLLDHFSAMGSAKAEGRAEGIAEGAMKGKMEANKDMARKLFEMGLSVDDIVKATDLSIEEVQKLLYDLHSRVIVTINEH